jgi:hypothetical protein
LEEDAHIRTLRTRAPPPPHVHSSILLGRSPSRRIWPGRSPRGSIIVADHVPTEHKMDIKSILYSPAPRPPSSPGHRVPTGPAHPRAPSRPSMPPARRHASMAPTRLHDADTPARLHGADTTPWRRHDSMAPTRLHGADMPQSSRHASMTPTRLHVTTPARRSMAPARPLFVVQDAAQLPMRSAQVNACPQYCCVLKNNPRAYPCGRTS